MTTVRKVWNGRANLVELEVDGPAGHIEALSLRLYNAGAHQWSLNFANSNEGALSPPAIGEFREMGAVSFMHQEALNGRMNYLGLICYLDTGPTSCRFEQAF